MKASKILRISEITYLLLAAFFAASAFAMPQLSPTPEIGESYDAIDEDVCERNPCGANTRCVVINGWEQCSCLPGYRGWPVDGCYRIECRLDADCLPHLACSANSRCENPNA